MHEQNEQMKQKLIKTQARSVLITVLTRRLESSDDLLAKIAASDQPA